MRKVSAQPDDRKGIVDEEPVPKSVIDQIWDVSQLGRLDDTFELFGHTFRMHVLAEREIIEAYSRSSMYEGTKASNLAFRLQCVAASIDEVDGNPLYVPLSPSEDAAARKTAVVMEWYPTVIDALYDKYVELTRRSDELVRAEKKS